VLHKGSGQRQNNSDNGFPSYLEINNMAQKTIVMDLDRCIGCHSCTVACKQENNLKPGEFWTKIHQIGPIGRFPDLEMYFLPVLCQHCRKPPCVKVCPTGASYKRKDGPVQVDRNKCIGCGYCIKACPYGVRYYSTERRVVQKCTLCVDLTDLGEMPACVKACVGKARFFGDIDDPKSEVSRKIQEVKNKTYGLVDVGNDPSVRYILRKNTWRG